MPYMDMNLNITKEQEATRKMVHEFSRDVLRPASLDLDKLDPEDVIARDSIFWDCFKKGYKIGLHKILIPEIYGGGGFDPMDVHIFSSDPNG